MSEEILIPLYQAWTEDRILDEYVNKGTGYEPLGLEVMLEVIQMKGLAAEAEQMLVAKGIREKNAEILKEQLYQQNTFGTVETDAEFLSRIKTKQGVYFEKVMMLGAKSHLFGFTMAIGAIILVIGFTFVFSGMINALYSLPIIAISGLLIYGALQVLKRNKVIVSVKDFKGKPKLEIALKNELVAFPSPIDYNSYSILITSRSGRMVLKRPNLYIIMRHASRRIFMLHEDQPPQNSMPFNWTELNLNAPELRCDLRITGHGVTKVELEKLKRILDGLTKKINKNKDA